ncbi:hypothetical protein DL93DRAFT_2158950 [Clavulina sp. PMI_390]|nr:hypothetical protein DL93DRAFT_2158950 [Clavulina sp. PMI_390]
MFLHHLLVSLVGTLCFLPQLAVANKWQPASLSSNVKLVYPTSGGVQIGSNPAFGVVTTGELSGLYYSLKISLLSPNGATIPVMSMLNVDVDNPSFNASATHACDFVNEADTKDGSHSIFQPVLVSVAGTYVATWNWTYTFPEQVNASVDGPEGVMCTGRTASETELVTRNFTVSPTTATGPTTLIGGVEAATFSVQPTGTVYTFAAAQATARVGLGWVMGYGHGYAVKSRDSRYSTGVHESKAIANEGPKKRQISVALHHHEPIDVEKGKFRRQEALRAQRRRKDGHETTCRLFEVVETVE